MYNDKTLVCKDCGQEFTFTAREQEFYAEKGFTNEPQRCKTCRDARKKAARGPRQMYDAVCARCGKACPAAGRAECPKAAERAAAIGGRVELFLRKSGEHRKVLFGVWRTENAE